MAPDRTHTLLIGALFILVVLLATGVSDLLHTAWQIGRPTHAQALPLPLPPSTLLSDRSIQMIVAPSGAPIVLYDPEHKRLILIVGALPRDTDVCINRRCLIDASWTMLADRPTP
jgi:hypothetical protein